MCTHGCHGNRLQNGCHTCTTVTMYSASSLKSKLFLCLVVSFHRRRTIHPGKIIYRARNKASRLTWPYF